MSEKCDKHKFIYGGIKYESKLQELPGRPVWLVYYYDWFYCERCLEVIYKKLSLVETEQSGIRFGATPK